MVRIAERVNGNFTNTFIIEGKYIFNGGETTPLRYKFKPTDEGKAMLEKYNSVLCGMMQCQEEIEYPLIDDFDELFANETSHGPAWPKNADESYAKISNFSIYYYDEDAIKYRAWVE